MYLKQPLSKTLRMGCSCFSIFLLYSFAVGQEIVKTTPKHYQSNEFNILQNVNHSAESDDITMEDISRLISEKKPFFVTGESYNYLHNSKIPEELNTRHPNLSNKIERSNIETSLSSIVIINDKYLEISMMLCPAGYRMALYPISINNEGIVTATIRPKIGTNYYNVSAYSTTSIVMVDANKAISNHEISSVPIELKPEYAYPFFAVTGIFNKPNNSEQLKCYVRNKLHNYVWIDEFAEQDYFRMGCRNLSLNDANRSLLYNLSKSVYSVDYILRFFRYSFDQKTYSCKPIKALGYSYNLKYFPANLNFSCPGGRNLELKFSFFNGAASDIYVDVDDFEEKNQRGEIYQDAPYAYDAKPITKNNGTDFSRENESDYFIKLNMTQDEAKIVSSNFNENKLVRVRFYLLPINMNDNISICDQKRGLTSDFYTLKFECLFEEKIEEANNVNNNTKIPDDNDLKLDKNGKPEAARVQKGGEGISAFISRIKGKYPEYKDCVGLTENQILINNPDKLGMVSDKDGVLSKILRSEAWIKISCE